MPCRPPNYINVAKFPNFKVARGYLLARISASKR